MNIRFTDSQDSPERYEIIKSILPTESIISQILEPSIEKKLFTIISKCIKAELEIYRKYPKKPIANDNTDKEKVKDFDPRNNETCFMGKAFKKNGNLTDAELSDYRKAMGTIPHPVWGNCTLLEIWGGDHFEEHNKMVVNAFKYGIGLIDTCPTIKVFVNPLFQNKKSKDFQLSDDQREYQEQMEMLLEKAMIFGVNEPKKRKR